MHGLVAKVLVGAKVHLRFEYPLLRFYPARPKFCSCEAPLVFNIVTNSSKLIMNVSVLKIGKQKAYVTKMS